MEKTVTVGLVDGLHAKTAAIFVQKAGQYQSEVHLKKGSSLINGKSILGLMSIVLKQGDEVTLVAEGLMGTKH
ncbi:HPr family phosphocarrier protein [Bacillus sp. JCM 19041]|uniref:HPr family phosphocarrier protein n=1 Tax=Bacillus sp. JCM 19041 TaxID=1460637 RepID=UPI003369F1B6